MPRTSSTGIGPAATVLELKGYTRIELVSTAWQAVVIATILIPRVADLFLTLSVGLGVSLVRAPEGSQTLSSWFEATSPDSLAEAKL